jgi:hypothetical protein
MDLCLYTMEFSRVTTDYYAVFEEDPHLAAIAQNLQVHGKVWHDPYRRRSDRPRLVVDPELFDIAVAYSGGLQSRHVLVQGRYVETVEQAIRSLPRHQHVKEKTQRRRLIYTPERRAGW